MLVGPSGTGKTHLAIALGMAACASARKVRFDEIRGCFPDDMPLLTPAERRAAIGIRQEHVQRRYRVF